MYELRRLLLSIALVCVTIVLSHDDVGYVIAICMVKRGQMSSWVRGDEPFSDVYVY